MQRGLGKGMDVSPERADTVSSPHTPSDHLPLSFKGLGMHEEAPGT